MSTFHQYMLDKAAEGKTVHVIYAVGNTVKDLDKPAVEGKVIFVDQASAFGYDSYQSEVLENPTWLDVAIAANEMIEATGDFHHVYLEDIFLTDYEINGVPVYSFSMGS